MAEPNPLMVQLLQRLLGESREPPTNVPGASSLQRLIPSAPSESIPMPQTDRKPHMPSKITGHRG